MGTTWKLPKHTGLTITTWTLLLPRYANAPDKHTQLPTFPPGEHTKQLSFHQHTKQPHPATRPKPTQTTTSNIQKQHHATTLPVGWQQPLTQQQFPYPLTIHLITGPNTLTASTQQQTHTQTGQGQHNYVDANITSIMSGMVQATLANLQQQSGIGNGTGGLQLSGKSTKILNGTNCFSLLGFCGLTIQDEVPEIFHILNSNKDPMTKIQALEDLLLLAQHGNALMNFML